MKTKEFIKQAIGAVHYYVVAHLDKTDELPVFDTYVVWSCATARNHKAMLSTTLPDGMYYEVIYDDSGEELMLYAYKKLENKTILEGKEIISMDMFIRESAEEVTRFIALKQDLTNHFAVYPTWSCKALQNWKTMMKTTDTGDSLYFEITFNGDKSEGYFDAYKHFDTISISLEDNQW